MDRLRLEWLSDLAKVTWRWQWQSLALPVPVPWVPYCASLPPAFPHQCWLLPTHCPSSYNNSPLISNGQFNAKLWWALISPTLGLRYALPVLLVGFYYVNLQLCHKQGNSIYFLAVTACLPISQEPWSVAVPGGGFLSQVGGEIQPLLGRWRHFLQDPTASTPSRPSGN